MTRKERQTASSEVDQLVSVLRDDQLRQHEPQKVIDAILRVGKLKPQRADVSEALMSLLGFKADYVSESQKYWPQGAEIHPIAPEDYYPALEALRRIGPGTVPTLLRVLAENNQQSIRGHNALHVFKFFFRDDPKKGKRILLEAVEAVDDSSLARQRLTEAIKAYESFFDQRN